MTIREFFNGDFSVDGDYVIKHYDESTDKYDILGYRIYELDDEEKDYEITYIYAQMCYKDIKAPNNYPQLIIEVKYPDED